MTLMISLETIETYSRTDISTIEECSEPSLKSTITFPESECVSNRNQSTHTELSINCLRDQLHMKNILFVRLGLIGRVMSFLVVFSLILMITANELTFDRVDHRNTKASWSLKLVISISTAVLLISILYYHYLDMIYYACRNRLPDWRVELTREKIFFITLELLICIIHPFPRSFPSTDLPMVASVIQPSSHVSTDVALSLPMFLRLYLCIRSFMIYSPLFRNIPLRSFGYLNHVKFNVYFLIKTCLEKYPTRSLITICTIGFLIGSWSLRASVYTSTGQHLCIADAMWLFIVTATTVGYGDIYPSTLFGRSIATIVGLFGLVFTAILIGIITQKLQLTEEEKHVYAFVSYTGLARKHRYQAANVIKFAVKSWYLKRHGKHSSMRYFRVQQKLFHAIKSFQNIRQKERSLQHIKTDVPEMTTAQPNTNRQKENMEREIMNIKTDVKNIKNELNSLNRNLQAIQDTLNLLVNNISK